jgi:hypothetical protein
LARIGRRRVTVVAMHSTALKKAVMRPRERSPQAAAGRKCSFLARTTHDQRASLGGRRHGRDVGMRARLEGAQPGAQAIVFGLGAAPAGATAPAGGRFYRTNPKPALSLALRPIRTENGASPSHRNSAPSGFARRPAGADHPITPRRPIFLWLRCPKLVPQAIAQGESSIALRSSERIYARRSEAPRRHCNPTAPATAMRLP